MRMKMENLEWIFSGIGTSILTGILGLVIGGGVGYKIGIRNSIRQKQKAHNNVNQSQIGQIVNNGNK